VALLACWCPLTMWQQTGVSAARGVGRRVPRSATPQQPFSRPLQQAPRCWMARAATMSTVARVGWRGCRCGSPKGTGGSHPHGGRHSMWAERAREAPARPPLAAPAAMPVCITWRHAASLAFQHSVFINVVFVYLLLLHCACFGCTLRACSLRFAPSSTRAREYEQTFGRCSFVLMRSALRFGKKARA